MLELITAIPLVLDYDKTNTDTTLQKLNFIETRKKLIPSIILQKAAEIYNQFS